MASGDLNRLFNFAFCIWSSAHRCPSVEARTSYEANWGDQFVKDRHIRGVRIGM